MSRANAPIEDSGALFSPIGDKRLYQKVVDQICMAIFQGKIRPGDRLPSEDKLASHFQVSRSAVREAVKVLETSGLVLIRRGRDGGTFVQERDASSLSQAYGNILRLALVEVSELTRARVLLESGAIQEAAKFMRPEDLKELRKNVREAERYYAQNDRENRLKTNLEFHVALGRLARNIILELNISAILSLLSYYLKTMQVTKEMGEATLKAHTRIVELLEQGKFEEASTENQQHIETVSSQLLRHAAKKFHGVLNVHLTME
jgi:DNA-binding FadR family transcriptional regulator